MRRPSLVSALGLALGLAVACASDPAPRPAALPTTGVVTLPSVLDTLDLRDLDLGTDALDLVLRSSLWDGELVVIGLDRPADQRFVVTTRPAGSFVEAKPGCGREPLVVPVGDDRLAVSTLTAPPDAVAAVARQLTITDGSIDTSRLDPDLGEVGRLPADWLLGGGGTRFTVGVEQYLVRRVGPSEQRLLLALRCPDPVHRMAPPPSAAPSTLAGYGPSRRRVGGRVVDSGASGLAQLAVVRGRPGVLVARTMGCCLPPDPDEAVRLAGRVRSVPAARLHELERSTQQRVEADLTVRLEQDLAGEGAVALARGRSDDIAWTLARRNARYLQGRVAPEVCWSAITDLDDAPDYDYMTECLPDEAATAPVVPAPTSAFPLVDHLWGRVADGVTSVVVDAPGHTSVRVATMGRWFVAALDPPAPTQGFAAGDLLRRTFVLRDGPVTVHALAGEREVGAVVVGKAGCPVPPGCPA